MEDYATSKKEDELYKEKLNKYSELLQKKDSKKLNTIQQPTMRFKPRTDLERIFYAVNSFSMGKISKKIVNDHLEKLNLNTFKKLEEDDTQKLDDILDNDKILDEEEIQELIKQKEFLNKQGYNEKNSETVKQIENILLKYNKNKIQIFDPKSRINNNNNNNYNNNNDNFNNKNKNIEKNNIKNSAIRKFNKNFDINSKTFFKAASVYSFKLDDYKKNIKVNELKNPNEDHFKKKISKENFHKLTSFNTTFNYKFNNNNNNINNTNHNRFDLTVLIKANENKNNNNNNNNNIEKKEDQSCFIEFDKIEEPYKTEENFFKENVYGSNFASGSDSGSVFVSNLINNNNNKKKKFKHYKNISENLNFNSYDNDFKEFNNNNTNNNNNNNNNIIFDFFNNNPNNSSNLINLNKTNNNNNNYYNINYNNNLGYYNSKSLEKEKLLYLKRISASGNLLNRGENTLISINKKETNNEVFSGNLKTKYNIINNNNEDYNNNNNSNNNININNINNNNNIYFREKKNGSKSLYDNNIGKSWIIKEEEIKKSNIKFLFDII